MGSAPTIDQSCLITLLGGGSAENFTHPRLQVSGQKNTLFYSILGVLLLPSQTDSTSIDLTSRISAHFVTKTNQKTV